MNNTERQKFIEWLEQKMKANNIILNEFNNNPIDKITQEIKFQEYHSCKIVLNILKNE